MMKLFPSIVKYIVIPTFTLVGGIYSIHLYVVKTAHTVVEPTEVKVELMVKNVEEIAVRTRNIEKILMERK